LRLLGYTIAVNCARRSAIRKRRITGNDGILLNRPLLLQQPQISTGNHANAMHVASPQRLQNTQPHLCESAMNFTGWPNLSDAALL